MKNLTTKNYWRIRAGGDNSGAEEFYKDEKIMIGFGFTKDFTKNIPETWQEFRDINNNLDTKDEGWFPFYILHRFIKKIQVNDIIITPINKEECIVGEIISEAYFGESIVAFAEYKGHCRKVKWLNNRIKTEDMSKQLASSIYGRGTMHSVTKYHEEIDNLIAIKTNEILQDETIEDQNIFALEKHLEDFMIANWNNTDFGKNYEIYSEGEEFIGQQFQTDTGPIDILAISKDKKEWLIIELKRGRASDSVVGQIQRYMAYIKDDIATPDQTVKGIIVAFDNDKRISRALEVTTNIDLYTYDVKFSLKQVK